MDASNTRATKKYCSTCNLSIQSSSFSKHVKSKAHINKTNSTTPTTSSSVSNEAPIVSNEAPIVSNVAPIVTNVASIIPEVVSSVASTLVPDTCCVKTFNNKKELGNHRKTKEHQLFLTNNSPQSSKRINIIPNDYFNIYSSHDNSKFELSNENVITILDNIFGNEFNEQVISFYEQLKEPFKIQFSVVVRYTKQDKETERCS